MSEDRMKQVKAAKEAADFEANATIKAMIDRIEAEAVERSITGANVEAREEGRQMAVCVRKFRSELNITKQIGNVAEVELARTKGSKS